MNTQKQTPTSLRQVRANVVLVVKNTVAGIVQNVRERSNDEVQVHERQLGAIPSGWIRNPCTQQEQSLLQETISFLINF